MRTNRSQNRRGGMVLMTVMVCMAIAMSLIVGWARIVLMEHHQIRAMENRLQAEWLADSALQRAAAKLIADRSYPGESWQMSAADFGTRGAENAAAKESTIGAATISVEPMSDRPEARQVRVSADYPTTKRAGGGTGTFTSRVSKQMIFDFSTPTATQVPEKSDTAPE